MFPWIYVHKVHKSNLHVGLKKVNKAERKVDNLYFLFFGSFHFIEFLYRNDHLSQVPILDNFGVRGNWVHLFMFQAEVINF